MWRSSWRPTTECPRLSRSARKRAARSRLRCRSPFKISSRTKLNFRQICQESRTTSLSNFARTAQMLRMTWSVWRSWAHAMPNLNSNMPDVRLSMRGHRTFEKITASNWLASSTKSLKISMRISPTRLTLTKLKSFARWLMTRIRCCTRISWESKTSWIGSALRLKASSQMVTLSHRSWSTRCRPVAWIISNVRRMTSLDRSPTTRTRTTSLLRLLQSTVRI